MADWKKMSRRDKNAVWRYYGMEEMLKPERAARAPRTGPSEHQLQAAVIQWWRLAHTHYSVPEFVLFAIPNGGARDAITGSRLKAEGVRRGIPDLMLAVPRVPLHGLYIEMKLPGNKLTGEQLLFREFVERNGYAHKTCYSSEEAIDAIKGYLA